VVGPQAAVSNDGCTLDPGPRVVTRVERRPEEKYKKNSSCVRARNWAAQLLILDFYLGRTMMNFFTICVRCRMLTHVRDQPNVPLLMTTKRQRISFRGGESADVELGSGGCGVEENGMLGFCVLFIY
jgi:hypothetical protein